MNDTWNGELNAFVIGRHMDYPTVFRPENIESSYTVEPGEGVSIRLDDKENLMWWLQITLNKEQLQQMLAEVEGILE